MAAIVAPWTAGAQTPAAPPTGPPFVVQSAGGDNLLQIDVLAQFDGRFAVEDESGAVVNAFTMRRFRPILQGRLLKHFEFFFNPDFGGGTTVVQDAYVDTIFSNAFRLRLGKSKTPIGLERLILANSLVFIERSLATALVPNRDVGIQAFGDLWGNTVSYMTWIGNGVTDGGSADVDTNDGKEVAARVIVRPFARAATSPLGGLAIGIAGSRGTIRELPVLRTATLLQPFLTYAGAVAEGVRTRVSPQVSYYNNAFSAFGEYVRSSQPIGRGSTVARVDHTAWEVTASYVLTGETATERGVRPRYNFDFGGGHTGAIQVAARWHFLEVDDAAMTLGLAAPDSSRKAEAFTAGVNWYMNPSIKYVLNLERTVFDGNVAGARPAENALVFRAQLFF